VGLNRKEGENILEYIKRALTTKVIEKSNCTMGPDGAPM